MKRLVSFFILPVLALAACSGGDGDADSAATDGWCSLAQKVQDSSDQIQLSSDSSGAAIGAAFEQFGALLDEAKGVAPDEIKDAVATSSKGIAAFDAVLEEVDYDLSALDESALAELESMGDEMDAATAEIEAYNLRECGIAASPDSEASDAPVSEESAVDGAGATQSTESADSPEVPASEGAPDPTSDWCVAARAVEDAGNPLENIDFTDPKAVESAVVEMVGLFRAAADVVPPELASAVEISLQAIEELEAALQDADWDLVDTDLSMLQKDERSLAAEADIEAYNEQVCGIAAGDDDGDDEESSFDPQAGTIRDQAIAELVASGFSETEASCVFDNFDFTDPDASEDPTVVMNLFAMCEIDLERVAELGG